MTWSEGTLESCGLGKASIVRKAESCLELAKAVDPLR